MGNTNLSINMNLPIPVPGVDPGPDWALNLNSCLTLLDGHNHSPGEGVLINPSGMDITSDLDFGGNNATSLRSTRFTVQSAPFSSSLDVNCLYDVNGDLQMLPETTFK
jgi:hypothetical protein